MQRELTLNEYQKKAHTTACYKDDNYPLFLLVEEVGELFQKISKARRGDYSELDVREDIAYELGDILWAIQEIANQRGYTLEKIAEMNLIKLANRQLRNVLKGNGDYR